MPRLKKAYLEISNVCNLACSFCPGTKREKGFLMPDRFQILAGRLRPYTDYLYLHPQLEEFLHIAEQLGFHVMVTTNGTLLPKQGPLLCASPAVRKINISLHSFESNLTGDRGNGHFHQYLGNCISFAKVAAADKRCALHLWKALEGGLAGSHPGRSGVPGMV